MSDSDFYNEYWKGNIQGGVLNEPPTWTEDNLKWHLDYFKPFCNGDVLDIGAGNGCFVHAIKEQNANIKTATALELSTVAIEQGQKAFRNIQFRQGSCDDIPFSDATFDTVFAIEVVEHILDIDKCLSEVYRVLRPGGYFAVTTTDFNWLKQVVIAMFFWEKFFYPNNPHIRFFTRRTLADLARKHGLIPVAHKWNRSYFGIMPKGQMAVFQKEAST
jgi:ubiquinone/menaquinone biosynthesis C-methylase UbiE